MATPSPRFLILDDPIPGSKISQLLGLFTHDPTSPLDRSAPSPLPNFISTHVNEYPKQTSVTLAVQSSSSEAVKSKLLQTFSLASSRKSSRRWDIESAAIKTYRLENQDAVFDAVMAVANSRRQVEALFRRPGQRTNRIYMIVGLKVLVDATIKVEQGDDRLEEANARVSMATAASVMVAPVLGGLTAVGGQWHKVGESNVVVSSKHEGELVFAVEYRVIKKSLFPNLRSKGSGVTFGKPKRWGWGEGVMGTDDGDDDEGEDSDGEFDDAKFPPLMKLTKDGAVFWETL